MTPLAKRTNDFEMLEKLGRVFCNYQRLFLLDDFAEVGKIKKKLVKRREFDKFLSDTVEI